jgi:hypothetical protein
MSAVRAKLPASAPGRARTKATCKREVDRRSPRDEIPEKRASPHHRGTISSKDRAFSRALYDYCLMPKYWEIL